MPKIYRAIKTNILVQGFGLANTVPSVLSVYQSLGLKGHEGWDWGVQCKNTAVKTGGMCEPAFCDVDVAVKITEIDNTDVNYGFGVVGISEDKDGIIQHMWWHLDSIAPGLKVGDTLTTGQMIGITGNTGRSTGPHLHRQIRPMARDSYGNLYKTQINNGYQGAIDMTPYFEDQFVIDVMNKLEAEVGILQKLVNLFKQLMGLK